MYVYTDPPAKAHSQDTLPAVLRKRHIKSAVAQMLPIRFQPVQHDPADASRLNHLFLGKPPLQSVIFHAVQCSTPMRPSSVKSLFSRQVALT